MAVVLNELRKTQNLRLRGTFLGVVGLLCLMLAGCAEVQTPFADRPETLDLAPEAQITVREVLAKNFGTPSDPRLPHYFPVDRGGAVFEITEFSADNRSQIVLEGGDAEVIRPGQAVEFLFDPEEAFDLRAEAAEEEQPDPLAGLAELTVAEFDPATGLLTLSGPLPELELLAEGLEMAVAANENLRHGGRLYNEHCLHCHGVSGDGNGPTAPFMQPRPRDYRLGIFKFTSTGPQSKISMADLVHVLEEGIPGTYMPSFNMLPQRDLELLAGYVRYLAIRGETEKNLDVEIGVDFAAVVLKEELEGVDDPEERKEIEADFAAELADFLKIDLPEIELGVLLDLADAWTEADEPDAIQYAGMPRPDPHGPSIDNPEMTSIENGRRLYLGKDSQCASCHGDTGRGNGYQTFQFQKKQDGSSYEIIGLHDVWGNPLPPRDLTAGIYRGGRRPVDLYRRIYAGIKGTPMPVFGGKGLTDAQIWDIVNYVLTMPHNPTPEPGQNAVPTTRLSAR